MPCPVLVFLNCMLGVPISVHVLLCVLHGETMQLELDYTCSRFELSLPSFYYSLSYDYNNQLLASHKMATCSSSPFHVIGNLSFDPVSPLILVSVNMLAVV